jgi:hypothetical protein
MDLLLWLIAIVVLPLWTAYGWAKYDAARQYIKNLNREGNLYHPPRFGQRLLQAFLFGLLGGIWWLDGLLAFGVLHIAFDPIKNHFTGRSLWYMGKSARWDTICRRVDTRYPGRFSFALEAAFLLNLGLYRLTLTPAFPILSQSGMYPYILVTLIATLWYMQLLSGRRFS